MTISRRTFSKLILAAFGAGALGSTAGASTLPAPFDKQGSVRMALVRYLSTGDFFESYLARRQRAGGGTRRQLTGVGHFEIGTHRPGRARKGLHVMGDSALGH